MSASDDADSISIVISLYDQVIMWINVWDFLTLVIMQAILTKACALFTEVVFEGLQCYGVFN